MAAIDFFNRVAQLAEEEGHHPDLHLVGYRNVAIELWTHAIGGLSGSDFIMAAKINQLPVALKARWGYPRGGAGALRREMAPPLAPHASPRDPAVQGRGGCALPPPRAGSARPAPPPPGRGGPGGRAGQHRRAAVERVPGGEKPRDV